ncbi:putative nicotinamide riboside kinase [Triangularia verruculosa]|uniref:Nicotinamide riboside kinase n=1 Tax=Triangularia verruculosa TaxID=2587418 RepID=A0AAN6XXR9_9PEZI|nr:putative nicotinamide riboside kinase [Triangularia verruculosa]
MPLPQNQKALIISLSGPSSSGKTTLSRLLRTLLPTQTFILHQDDFYLPESHLPLRSGHRDWDCPQSLNLPSLALALSHIKSTGSFPPFVDSKEDQNTTGPIPPASPAQISLARAIIAASSLSSFPPDLKICILDGFLLYSQQEEFKPILEQIDIKLFLLASEEKAIARRKARDGYVTLEGFWKDPEGYVEDVVWPNFVEQHAYLFQDGNVKGGKLDKAVLEREGILAMEGGEEEGFGEVLIWAVGEVVGRLERILGAENQGE